MELSWSTLLLEIINFALLMWLLLHFFYRPLQGVIARRQTHIQAQMDDAQKLKEEADQLREQYEHRLEHWEQEQQSARQTLQQELSAERTRLEQSLVQSLEQQRQKAAVVQQRQQLELQHQLEQQALQQGGRFATKLLTQAAGPELQSRLLQLLLDSLPELPEEQRSAIREQGAEQTNLHIEVASAYPLSETDQHQLQQAFQQLLDAPVNVKCSLDSQLIAGLEVTLGPWVLHANLRDELKGFTEFGHEQG